MAGHMKQQRCVIKFLNVEKIAPTEVLQHLNIIGT
jgi:hypothetical protein